MIILRIIEEKINNFSASKKSFKSENISFAIVQQMYKSISKNLNLVYSNLIKNDYSSKLWWKDTSIIFYTAELNDKLLNFDQMKDRKQKSVMNAVLNLVHNVQTTKSCKNMLIYLLLAVKKVFNHVALKQVVKILIKLKVSINWIKCFLQIWVINLAFKNKHQKLKKIIMMFLVIFYSFIKCMQSMTIILSKRCVYAKLQVTWLKSMLCIFSLNSHIDRMHIRAQ